MPVKRFYSQTTNEQSNPNSTALRTNWQYMNNANGNTLQKAVGTYKRITKTVKPRDNKYDITVSYYIPNTVACADFRITSKDIPSSAYINKVTFHIGMSVDQDTSPLKVKAPVGYFMIYGGKGKVTQATAGHDGWYGSTYVDYPTQYLSTNEKDLKYSIPGTEWNKMGYPTSRLYEPEFGIDFGFNQPERQNDTDRVFLRYCYVEIDYVLPDYRLSLSRVTSQNNPHEFSVGSKHSINAVFKNTTKGNSGNQTVKIKLPFGTSIVSNSQPLSRNSDGTYNWVVTGAGLKTTTNSLTFKSEAFGLRVIEFTYGSKTYPYYIYPQGHTSEYEEANIENGTIQACRESCWKFSSKINTPQSTVTYYVTVDGQNKTDWSKISEHIKEEYNIEDGDNILARDWSLEDSSRVQGVHIVNTTNNSITFNIPTNKDVEIKFTGCFIPLVSGNNTIKLVRQIGDSSKTYTSNYTCLETSNEIVCTIEPTYFYDHRVVTIVDTLGHVIPIGVKSTDRVMVEGVTTLKGHIWEEQAYIGSIPVNTSHYDPSTDYTNELLKQNYKNKKYVGKKGEIEEKIGLKIKLPPKDWTTLEGLVKLDKAIPINLIPKAFEGDVLNHRGWIELYGIKGVSKTNPLWYDGELDVEYLSHNINTRFSIKRGARISQYTLPKLTVPVLESGEEFANYTYINAEGDIESNGQGYFTVDTDGTYIYDDDEDIDESLRTLITMDNEQYINIKSDGTLAEQTEIVMTWNSTKIPENRENNIERIIYLTNSNGKPLFKYQYADYSFDEETEYYTCMVTASKLLSDDTWEVVLEHELLLSVDLESVQLTINANGEVVEEEELSLEDEEDEELDDEDIYSFNDYTYGSTLTLEVNRNQLKLTDTGYDGQSISLETDLVNDLYVFDLQFHNHNVDADTEDVVTFFNFEVAESMITSDWSNYYGKMYVSSFPIHDKKLLFTRQCDEGTIYYFEDDGTSFSYIQDPFYMYFCGVDIESHEGSSLLTLDNSYTTFYLDNGLVRLGFNRLNGDLYLSKYDTLGKEYVNVAYLHGTSANFRIGAYSDDKIEIISGTTTYTMYRGHPYVVVKHPKEDLYFDMVWNQVWAEKVNGVAQQYPMFWSFVNNSNLLPSCVGGRDINSSCLTGCDINNTDVNVYPSLTMTKPSPIYNDELSIWTLSATEDILNEGVMILVDGEVSDVIKVVNNVAQTNTDGSYIQQSLVHEQKFALIFDDNKEHTIRAVYVGTNNKGIAYTNLETIIAQQKPTTNNTPSGIISGSWKLEIVKLASTFTYMSTPDWQFKLTKGGKPVKGKLIQLDLPHGGTWTKETDANGIIKQGLPKLPDRLNTFRNWKVGKSIIQARFYDYTDGVNNIVKKASKTINIVKGTPIMKFTGAGKKGKQAIFKLEDPQGYPLTGKKVIISVGGKKYTKTTNENGRAKLVVNKKGYKTYKITYAGDANLKQKTWTFHETVN